MKQPLLSICIPTYNKSMWLDKSLEILIPQLRDVGDDVELIVSNNASTDNTKHVLDHYSELHNITINENVENLGATKNFHICSRLARGRYVWTLGDDDFVVDQFVPKLINIMRDHADIPFYYIQNIIWRPTSDVAENDLHDLSLLYPGFYANSAVDWRIVDKLATIAVPETGYFNAISNFIMYKEHCEVAFALGVNAGEPFTSIESIFSHAVYVANNLLSSPCICISSPGTLCAKGIGWQKYNAITYLKWYPELFMLMVRRGADKAKANSGRRSLFGCYDGMFLDAMKGRIERSECFSFLTFTVNNFMFGEYWSLLYRVIRNGSVRRLQSLYRKVRPYGKQG